MKTVLASALIVLFVLVSAFPARCERVEPLRGISVNPKDNSISIIVLASGCTQKEHFRFTLENDVLAIIRTEPDSCKAMPMPITLTFTVAEAGLKAGKGFHIKNPLSFQNF